MVETGIERPGETESPVQNEVIADSDEQPENLVPEPVDLPLTSSEQSVNSDAEGKEDWEI